MLAIMCALIVLCWGPMLQSTGTGCFCASHLQLACEWLLRDLGVDWQVWQ